LAARTSQDGRLAYNPPHKPFWGGMKMLDQPPADSENSFQVKTWPRALPGWVNVILFSFASLFCAHDFWKCNNCTVAHDALPMWGFIGFMALGVYVVLSSGDYTFNDDAAEYKNFFGRWRFYWRDITTIEISVKGTILLLGSNQRFIIISPGYIRGEQRKPAFELISKKLTESNILPKKTKFGDFLWNKNCRLF